jgi:hypothetical protein
MRPFLPDKASSITDRADHNIADPSHRWSSANARSHTVMLRCRKLWRRGRSLDNLLVKHAMDAAAGTAVHCSVHSRTNLPEIHIRHMLVNVARRSELLRVHCFPGRI